MFTLPDLPYPYNALEPYIDEQTMQLHHDKHHGVYVKNLNDFLSGHDDLLAADVEMLIADLNKIPEEIRMKVRNNGGQHANHSLFWRVMAPPSKQTPSGKLKEAIDRSFGSFSSFQEQFEKAALGRFGSGWVWLTSNDGRLVISDTVNGDSPLMEGKTPILGIDVWEHAYYLKYQNRRVDYVKAWWNVVNWSEVEKNLKV